MTDDPGGWRYSCVNSDLNRDSPRMSDETRKTGRVVIVDDDSATRQMGARYFEEHNVPVSAVCLTERA